MRTDPSTSTTRARRAAALRCFVATVLLCAAGTRAAESVTTMWVQRYSHPTTSPGNASTVVTDHAGNVIVAGAADDGDTGAFLTIKYSGAGVPLWTNRYNGPENLGAAARALAVDDDDNVFVTGICSSNQGLNSDYGTIKYSSAGVPLWTNSYNGPGTSDNGACAIAVNDNGNVFVSGYSGLGMSFDYATVAYSNGGVPLWTNRYNGAAENYDAAIAVDSSGNVFVAGTAADINGFNEYVTVAYSGAGMALWTNRYNGPADGNDEHAAIAVDASGNVFVTGTSESAAAVDYATLAYSGAGVPLWTNRYNRTGDGLSSPSDVAVDASGNVFVTGFSDYDFATIKYSGAGVPLWTNRYNGPANNFDAAQALAVDNSGNVLVAGYSGSAGSYHYATIKYSGAGMLLWAKEYWGANFSRAVAVDSGGNVFVTGLTFVTVAFSSTGALMWTNGFSAVGNRNDWPYALAVNSNGNVFVTGTSELDSSGTRQDYVTVAYSSAGMALWTNRYPGAIAPHIAVDESGDVFVTGSSSNDYATFKYSGAGVPLWTNRYDGPGNSQDFARAIAVDGSGNVFVTGRSEYDYATIKYSSAGAPLWIKRYDGPANGDDVPFDVAVDGGGNVIVTGYSVGVGTAEDFLTIKYSAAGALLWSNRYNGPANNNDGAQALVADNSNHVIVTGLSVGIGGNYDYSTIKYSGAGVPLWTNRYPATPAYLPAAMAVDGSRNVFVTGTAGEWPAVEFVTVKYSEAGAPLWTNRHTGWAAAIAADAQGNVFVAGNSSDDREFVSTIKYSGAGVPLWTNSYPASGGQMSVSGKSSLAIGPDGAALVTGRFAGGLGRATDFVTLKLVSVPVLEIRRSSSDVILSWPSSFSDFTLQENTSPVTSTGWSNFGGNVQDDGTNRTVTVGPPTGSQFYRLFKP